jgi:hypothetical protein
MEKAASIPVSPRLCPKNSMDEEARNEWKQTDTRGNEEACHMKIFQILPFTTNR